MILEGYQALLGKSAQWRLPDHVPDIILKAIDFATEITLHNVQGLNLNSEEQISQEHVTNNLAVRQTLLIRGILPEGEL